jgi:hypothetical protein
MGARLYMAFPERTKGSLSEGQILLLLGKGSIFRKVFSQIQGVAKIDFLDGFWT